MRRLLLQSLMLGILLIPMIAAREASAMRGLKKGLAWFVGFSLWYTLALRFLYPHLS